ncbi:MAG: oxidoreductase-like domain-containing protein [Arenimonas sp.]|uniref:oxidoreductase-like domain-containing protein n=1 Tax=Arenimonas sp. TaxID=1872635 RepID=UPI0025C1A858|nr:oxidoreductase-like domain-containing protein [Arenimonas sp.]MBW8367672.1 oxidoreductase-like domain-containing protein [Arenimonas sp.]
MSDLERDPPPVPPEKPLPSDCCDSGCDRCVHDIYADERTYFEQRLAEWLARQ